MDIPYKFYLTQAQDLIVIDSDSRRNFGRDLGILAYNHESFVMIILFAVKGLRICYKISILSLS